MCLALPISINLPASPRHLREVNTCRKGCLFLNPTSGTCRKSCYQYRAQAHSLLHISPCFSSVTSNKQITGVSVPVKALPDSGYCSYPVQVNSLKQVSPYSLALKGEQKASREHKPREVTRTSDTDTFHWNNCKFEFRDLDPPALLSVR